LEKDIERPFVKEARNRRLFCIKMNIVGQRGLPDRMILGPNRLIFFVEFKRPGGKPRKLQERIINVLKEFGFNVFIISEREAVDTFWKTVYPALVSSGGDGATTE
jgi:hypothetical protein